MRHRPLFRSSADITCRCSKNPFCRSPLCTATMASHSSSEASANFLSTALYRDTSSFTPCKHTRYCHTHKPKVRRHQSPKLPSSSNLQRPEDLPQRHLLVDVRLLVGKLFEPSRQQLREGETERERRKKRLSTINPYLSNTPC